ncbi:MAG: AbrB/MazE/SpoVT family DNA-binding domain-containing protein [Bryobacter sp.]|nr:AbrB/MazE/SpoVT family DNA-binding domain-containing protein [Bryobacter sp.]
MAEFILQMGKRGTLVIPVKLRRTLGLEEGSLVVLTERGATLELRKAEVVVPEDEVRTKRSQASAILNAAKDLGEYFAALEEVRAMGLDPDEIPHERFSS